VKFFHYLFENHPGEGNAVQINNETVGLGLPDLVTYELPVDHRDKRVLVVIDGELLLECIPKAGDCILSVALGELTTNIEHLRRSRFGTPSYKVDTGKGVAKLQLMRHFLLLTCGNFVFRRFRDKRSLGPMYIFVEVRKDANGASVVWRNSTY